MRIILLLVTIVLCASCNVTKSLEDPNLKLWYDHPAKKWGDAFPQGNGKLASMCYGDPYNEKFQLNEESLWAGAPSNPYAENYREKLSNIQQMILDEKFEEAHEYGLNNLVATPTSFRSYEPLADLLINFDYSEDVSNYYRELDMSTGVCKVSYDVGDSHIVRECFISAPDNVLCIRITSNGKEKINCNISFDRVKDMKVTALPGGILNMDGQIIDDDSPEAFDPNKGGSGEGGAHMRFASRVKVDNVGGEIISNGDNLRVKGADEVVLFLTAATDYNLNKLNFDRSIDPGLKSSEVLAKVDKKTWSDIRNAHIEDHSSIFNTLSLDFGISENANLPTDKRLLAFKNGSNDQGVAVQLFQFGRYLLMGSSRESAILPANLQGKWSEKMWSPWGADYHLNVNLQMNYWLADVTNLSKTFNPLINWFELITENSKPLAKEMFGSDGWFACHAVNSFGRVTPSASTTHSQFINGVLDPLAGAWMLMNLWDHYAFTQDKQYLKDRLYPMLNGASEFILDYMVEDQDVSLHFVPSTSPENRYYVPGIDNEIRITSTSTYHLSIIKSVFKATKEAESILDIKDGMSDRIIEAERKLPDYLIDSNGRIAEWREERVESEPGHRHLSHLLGVYPFDLITPETPELFEAAKNSLAWRKVNGQGGGMGWAAAHSMLIHARFLHDEDVYSVFDNSMSEKVKTNYLRDLSYFQIDCSFGLTSGIAEAIIQSHRRDEDGDYIIQLIPSIPQQWSSGSIKGVCARGAFVVDMSWKDSKVEYFEITSKMGGQCKVIANDKIYDLSFKEGEKVRKHCNDKL